MGCARRILACLLASAAASVLLVAPAHGYEPRVPDGFFGTSAPGLAKMARSLDDSALNRHAAGIAAAGIDYARVTIDWRAVERFAPVGGLHTYDWASTDKLVAALAHRGVALLPSAWGTPVWASDPDALLAGCGGNAAVGSPYADDFAAFAEALVRRYGRSGRFWSDHPGVPDQPVTAIELWNEPNWAGFWCPGPDPEAFAPLVAASARAVREVDPQLRVILGGLVLIKEDLRFGDGSLRGIEPGDFLARAITREPSLPELIDSVGIHLYDPEADMNISLLGWFRARLEAAGMNEATLHVTEFGWRTAGGAGAVTEEQRTQSYRELMDQLPRTNCRIEGVAAHDWATEESDPANAHHWYGIADPDTAALYPSGQAYRDGIALFEGRGVTPPPTETISVCDEPLPDQDGDGTPDETDDFPLDPERQEDGGAPTSDDPAGAPARSFAPRVQDGFFGVADVWMPSDPLERQRHYDGMQAAGVTRVRETLEWRDIEAAPGENPRFRWSDSDRRFFSFAKRDISALPTIINRRAGLPSDPAAADDAYAEFMSALAARYGAGGTFWAENRHLDASLAPREYEVWTAANGTAGAWDGSPSAAEYAATYDRARSALRAIDPGSRAIASLLDGGPGGSAAGFIRGMVAARPGLAGEIDGVYVMGGSARSTAELEGLVASVRTALEASGNPRARLYVGLGVPTQGSGAMTEDERAAFLGDAASSLPRADCGVNGLFANAWVTAEADATNPFDWYGIASRADGSAYPSGATYAATAATFLGYGTESAARAATHPCMREPLDRDRDGAPDPVDEAPLDPAVNQPTAGPPDTPAFTAAPPEWSNTSSPTLTYTSATAEAYHCRLDDGPWEPCTGSSPLSGLAQGEHAFRARAVDALGMVSPVSTHRWSVDTRAPETTITSGPSGTIPTDRAEFTIASEEPEARYICHLDSGNRWCDPTMTYAGIADGSHAFRAAAVDRAGNVDLTPAVARLEVRTVPAMPSITSVTEGSSQTPIFHFTGRYAVAFECRFDDEPFLPCSGLGLHAPAVPLRDGSHRFAVRGIGGTGKAGDAAITSVTVKDTTPPETIVRSLPPAELLSDEALVELDSDDPYAVFYCQLDEARWSRCDRRTKFAGLSEGAHVIRAAAYDSGGNLDPTPATVEFAVRLTPQSPTITSGPRAGATSGPEPRFEFSAPAAARVECRFDDAPFAACAGPSSHEPGEPLAPGSHSFAVRGIGGTGIVGPVATREFTVDTAAPRIAVATKPLANRRVSVRLRLSDASRLVSVRHRVDAGSWKRARTRFTLRLRPGKRTIVVEATDEWGNSSRAAKRFRVKR
jgi:hypothetical protein